MDLRRLLLYLAAGAIAVLLAQGLTRHRSDDEPEGLTAVADEFDRAERHGRPGEVVWSNWENTAPAAAPVEHAVRDVLAAEMRFEDLPERVRGRIEADFKGLDVVLPSRNAVSKREER
jgi:hypothetical protein